MSFESLQNSKAALDAGLITQDDYEVVKWSFLRAQQIKAGLDSGLIKGSDYEQVKREYLDALTHHAGEMGVQISC